MRPSWFFLSLVAHTAGIGVALGFAVGVARSHTPPRVEIRPSVAAVPAPPPAQPLPPVQEERVVDEQTLLEVTLVQEVEPPSPPVDGAPTLRPVVPPSLQRVRPAVERDEASEPAPAAAEPAAHVEAVRCADNEPPIYPERERRQGHEGVVVLTVRVSSAGRVIDVTVKTPSPYPGLDREAVRAVWQWRFEPARRHGEPVVSDTDVEVEFVLHAAAR